VQQDDVVGAFADRGVELDVDRRLQGRVAFEMGSLHARHDAGEQRAVVSGDAARPDNIVYDITPQAGQMPGVSTGGWGHPECSAAATGIAAGLDPTQ